MTIDAKSQHLSAAGVFIDLIEEITVSGERLAVRLRNMLWAVMLLRMSGRRSSSCPPFSG